MTTILVDGEPAIEAIGYDDPRRALEAHGYDPETVDWEVDDPDAELAAAIEAADSLEELKAALLGESGGAKARGRRPDR